MKQLLSAVALLGLTGAGISLRQQTPSSAPSSAGQANSAPQQHQTEPTSADQSARSFEGRITKEGGQFVLQDSASSTSYQLDDQEKAKQYEGKQVKVMATMDPKSNILHVVDIVPAESR
jgi:uncharacterized protein DUF5818